MDADHAEDKYKSLIKTKNKMKRLLLLAAILMSVGFSVKAQTSYTFSPVDTLKDAATTYAYLSPAVGAISSTQSGISGAKGSLGVMLTVTKISGTVAGTVTLQVSNDFVTWTTHPSATAVTLTDIASQVAIYSIGSINFKYYRLVHSGGTTLRAKLSNKWVYRDL